MRHSIAAVLFVLAASNAQAQKQLDLYASIVDDTGSPAVTVQAADLRVLEKGLEATVLKVENARFPVKLQLLVDNGVGLGGDNLIHLRNGVRGLLEGLPEDIEVTLVVTGGQPRFVVRPTLDRGTIFKGLALLAPDSGAGKFVESLKDASERIERDKSVHAPVIVSFATTAGDLNVLDRDVQRMSERLQTSRARVNVVLLSLLGSRSAQGGYNQTEIGIGVTKMTGGRFETIAAPVRLATLLPELGAEIAQAHRRLTHQFKITVARPAGVAGDPDEVSLSVFGGLTLESVAFDGRLLH